MIPHRYTLELADAGAHLLRVSVRIANPDPDGQQVAIPAWTPGSYMVRDFARNVIIVAGRSDDDEVPVRKIDKSTWRAAPCNGPLTLTFELFAYEPGVRGLHFDNTHAFVNGSGVFPRVSGQAAQPCELDIRQPGAGPAAAWRVATSMQSAGAEKYGYGLYRSADYDELTDHPIEIGDLTIGEFEAAGIPHAIAIRGRTDCDMGRLCHDLESLCEQHLSLLGAPSDFDRYLFLLHAPGNGYGGLEHRWSSSLVCSRDSLPQRGVTAMDDNYATFLGLASHEYFHLWQVKRIRPTALAQSDLLTEAYTESLWVFEGITSYYDDLQLLRAGLIDEARYLKLLGRTITRVCRGAGRTRQSVADSSFDAWIKFYKPDVNAANAIVSYYAKGSLIALCLDLKLRKETDRTVSLDDVMRACWERYGETGRTLAEGDFEALCEEVSGLDLRVFFDQAVRGTGELPLEPLLATHGVTLNWRAASNRDDKGGEKGTAPELPPLTLGATLAQRDGKSCFTTVDSGGPAELAGVAPGDIAVAIDGLALATDNLAARLRGLRAGAPVELAVFRGDELLRLNAVPVETPADTAWLERKGDAGEAQQDRQRAWLDG